MDAGTSEGHCCLLAPHIHAGAGHPNTQGLEHVTGHLSLQRHKRGPE